MLASCGKKGNEGKDPLTGEEEQNQVEGKAAVQKNLRQVTTEILIQCFSRGVSANGDHGLYQYKSAQCIQ